MSRHEEIGKTIPTITGGSIDEVHRNGAQAKVSKVLNLDFQFFCIDFLGKSKKEFVIMFISRQDQKCVLIAFMHYPKQDKRVIFIQ